MMLKYDKTAAGRILVFYICGRCGRCERGTPTDVLHICTKRTHRAGQSASPHAHT